MKCGGALPDMDWRRLRYKRLGSDCFWFCLCLLFLFWLTETPWMRVLLFVGTPIYAVSIAWSMYDAYRRSGQSIDRQDVKTRPAGRV